MFEGFEAFEIKTEESFVFARRGGSGPAVLLLHGFPETHLMWRDVAAALARRFSVVCADLRGYGRSGCPPSQADHSPYSKRAMAKDLVEAMAKLGFERFGVAGHDRGGRVAYRMALDHPERVERLAVLDVLPVLDVWERADKRLALAFWPWSLLAQPEPLPERLIAAAPDAVVDDAIAQWDTPAEVFEEEVRGAYVEALGDPAHVHAICEEYRAAASIDVEHDRKDREEGRCIQCPVLALWSAKDGLAKWYEDDGGPLGLWRAWAADVSGGAVEGGHFFPEEMPERTAEALARFFGGGRGR